MRDAFDGVFEVWVVPGEIERALVIPERLLHLPAALQNLRQSTNGGEVVWHAGDDDLELGLRRVELAELDQRAAQGDTRREIAGVADEAGAADLGGFLVGAEPPAFLCQLRKSNRRRIPLDPASKFEYSRTVGHRLQFMG